MNEEYNKLVFEMSDAFEKEKKPINVNFVADWLYKAFKKGCEEAK